MWCIVCVLSVCNKLCGEKSICIWTELGSCCYDDSRLSNKQSTNFSVPFEVEFSRCESVNSTELTSPKLPSNFTFERSEASAKSGSEGANHTDPSFLLTLPLHISYTGRGFLVSVGVDGVYLQHYVERHFKYPSCQQL